MEIFFSIIIPAYNSEQYVGEAIESALIQKDVSFEVIVVNDGSTDNTLDEVNKFNSHVKVVTQENRGLSAARNSGVRVAKGNYLAFLDSDDVWLPGKLYTQSLKILQGFKIVYTNRYNFGQVGDLPEKQSDVVVMAEGDLWEKLLFGNMITASSSVIEKDLFQRCGGFRSVLRSCEDWDLWLRCAEANLIGYCPVPLVKYRIHTGGLSKNYRFMSEMREKVIIKALNSDRGRKLSFFSRQHIFARTWSSSGWDAAKSKDIPQSLVYYAKALTSWPFDRAIWYDVARVLAGRL